MLKSQLLFCLAFLSFFFCRESSKANKKETSDTTSYKVRIQKIRNQLHIPDTYGENPFMPIQFEAASLTVIQTDANGRKHELNPEAADAWKKMVEAAKKEGVVLQAASAYRSVERQRQIIQKKLDGGQKITDILKVNTAPGYSEHHTGRALDITTPGIEPITLEFENTKAFAWLVNNAKKFNFELSYPKNNSDNIIYEPWHWCYKN
jgi:D-alanyl-D-alanine carboxypeptidase